MKFLGMFVVGALLSCAQMAAAAVVVLAPGTPHNQIEAWGQQRPVIPGQDNPFVSGTVVLGDGVFYSSTGSSGFLGMVTPYAFAGRDTPWQSNSTPLTGVNAAEGSVSFTFATPVSAIIAQTNWAAASSDGRPVTVSIFDEANNLIETLVLNDGTKDLTTPGAYVGFIERNATISRIEFSNGFIGARDFYSRYESNTFDDPNDHWSGGGPDGPKGPGDGPGGLPGLPGAGGVPEPGVWAMMLFGFGAIGVMARRNRGRAALAA